MCGSLTIFTIAHVIDEAVELGNHMKQSEDDFHMGDLLSYGFDRGVPHIHDDGLKSLSLPGGHAVEKGAERFGASVLPNPHYSAALIVEYHGQVPVPFAEGDFIDSQDPEPFIVRLPILLLQKELADILDGFPIQVQVFGHLSNGHELTQIVDVPSQAHGDPHIRLKKLQILDDDSVASGTKGAHR